MGNGTVPEEGFIQDTLALINTAMSPVLTRMDDVVSAVNDLRTEVRNSQEAMSTKLDNLEQRLRNELSKKADKEDVSTERIEKRAALVAKAEIEKASPKSKTSKAARAESKSPWLLLLTGPQGIFIVALIFAVIVLLIAIAALTGRDANTLVPVPTEKGGSDDAKGNGSCLFAPGRGRVYLQT